MQNNFSLEVSIAYLETVRQDHTLEFLALIFQRENRIPLSAYWRKTIRLPLDWIFDFQCITNHVVRFLNTYGINGLNNQTRHDDKR